MLFAASVLADIDSAMYRQLTTDWPGPYGGLPPVELATPEFLEAAYVRAVEDMRNEVAAIVDNPGACDVRQYDPKDGSVRTRAVTNSTAFRHF